jgi:hypothetical protein
MKFLFRVKVLFILSVICLNSYACGLEAFGFELGKPVPPKTWKVTEALFQGGSSPGNVIRTFMSDVPEPLPQFENYVFWSNRDKKVTFAITAYRPQKADPDLYENKEKHQALINMTKVELNRLKDIFEKKYGFKYQTTNESGLTLKAETTEVRSIIGAYIGRNIYIECSNIALENKADAIALKTFFKSQ